MERALLEKLLERNMGHVHSSWDHMPQELRMEFLVVSEAVSQINGRRHEQTITDDEGVELCRVLLLKWLTDRPKHAAQLMAFSLNTTAMICAGFFQDELREGGGS